MANVVRLAPHDPLPEGVGPHVLVLHRLAEDDPDGTDTTISLIDHTTTVEHPVHPDGRVMTLDEAIDAATQLADARKIKRVFVVDRTQGAREHDILSHGGDHTFGSETLDDDDLEDGEHGADMRDRRGSVS